MAVQQAKVDQAQAIYDLKKHQLDALNVRAGIAGVLTDLPLAVGQHVTQGTMLAQVVQPNQLKAQLKIAETQARDIRLGQPASIDTHNGLATVQSPGSIPRYRMEPSLLMWSWWAHYRMARGLT